MDKEKLIDELTLLDTSFYRCKGLSETPRKYKHEPPRFRIRLKAIYDKMSVEDLQELLNIKNGL